VAGARVDRIAATAGCNKNLLYVYFGSKENLFTAVLELHLVRVYEDIPFTPDDLPGFAGRVFDFAMTRPDLMRLLAWSTLEQSTRAPGPGRPNGLPRRQDRCARPGASRPPPRCCIHPGVPGHDGNVPRDFLVGRVPLRSGDAPRADAASG
jgi:AcrR family transcriptional regulator